MAIFLALLTRNVYIALFIGCFSAFTILAGNPLPLAMAVGGHLPLVFAALVGGSVFGDHSSPISDTAILSYSTTGCDLMDHVTSQLPYTLISAAFAIILYLVAGFIV